MEHFSARQILGSTTFRLLGILTNFRLTATVPAPLLIQPNSREADLLVQLSKALPRLL